MNFTRQMDRWKSLGGKVMVLGGDEKVMVHGQVNLNWQITSLLKGLDGKLSRRPDGKFKWTTRRGICALEGQCYLRKNSHFYAATPLWWSMGEVTGKCERGHRSNGSFGLFRVRQCSDLHFYILGFSHNLLVLVAMLMFKMSLEDATGPPKKCVSFFLMIMVFG